MEARVGLRGRVVVRWHAADTPGEGPGREEHDGVAGDADVDGLAEADRGQEVEGGDEGAGDRAEGVHRVEHTDPRTDLRVFRHRIACEQRQSRAHQRRAGHENDEGAEEMEERRAQRHRLGRRVESTRRRDVEPLHGLDQEGDAERADRDPELEHAVGEDRSDESSHESRGDRCPERETRHVGSEDRDHGELGGSEQEREFPRPRGLIEQGREAGDEKADQEEEESEIH